ncbi:hypothetical protein ERJ75_001705600 [Trypanosoma vivax]|nr:hypothetical protein ERJ75_001705600 [Trypanosoma vivax]
MCVRLARRCLAGRRNTHSGAARSSMSAWHRAAPHHATAQGVSALRPPAGPPWKRGGRAIAVGGNNRRSERPAPTAAIGATDLWQTSCRGSRHAVQQAARGHSRRSTATGRRSERRATGDALLPAGWHREREQQLRSRERDCGRTGARGRHSWPATVGRDFAANAVQGAGSSRRLTASRRQKHGGDALIGRFAR